MKTAISIPDPVFKAAEKFAKQLGLSRSALYTKAVERYLREHRNYRVTEKLNKVYGEIDSQVDSAIAEMQPSQFMEGDKVVVQNVFEDQGQGLSWTTYFPQRLARRLGEHGVHLSPQFFRQRS